MNTPLYNYHPETGEFIDSSFADTSPLEPEVVLIPAYSTTTPPPATGKNEVALFIDKHWVKQPDYRGQVFYTTPEGTATTISEMGPIPQNLTAEPCPSPLHYWSKNGWCIDAKTAQAMQWQKIQTERDHRTYTGGYKVSNKWFHSDANSRSQQLALSLQGDTLPKDLQWKTMDGSFVVMTPALARQILAASTASDQAIFKAAEAHKAAMECCENPADYDFSTGWPEVFAG